MRDVERYRRNGLASRLHKFMQGEWSWEKCKGFAFFLPFHEVGPLYADLEREANFPDAEEEVYRVKRRA